MGKLSEKEKLVPVQEKKPEKKKRTRKSKALVKAGKNLPVSIDPQNLLTLALKKDVDIDKFERLVKLAKDFEERQAEKLFNEALARFQKICPVILKEKPQKAKNKKTGEKYIRNYYAPLGDIIKEVKDPLSECGFTYIIDTEPGTKEKHLKVFCDLFHKAGHKKRSSIEIPFDTTEYMNDIQKVISTQTYAKRIVFCNVCGIMTADKDDDGNNYKPVETGSEPDTAKKELKKEYDSIMKIINESKIISEAKKIEYRKKVNKSVDHLVDLKKIHDEIRSFKKPVTQEIKLTNEQIEKMATETLSLKDKKGNRIFVRDECIVAMEKVRGFIKSANKAEAMKYINGLKEHAKKAGGKA